MTEATDPQSVDENKLIAERRDKLTALRGQGIAFPNDFKVGHFAGDLQAEYADKDAFPAEAIEALQRRVQVAGRIVLKRVQGKVSFVQVQDMTGRIQLFVHAGTVGDVYEAFKGWDMGDIVGAEGLLMRTKTGELSVKVDGCACSPRACARCPTSSTACRRAQALARADADRTSREAGRLTPRCGSSRSARPCAACAEAMRRADPPAADPCAGADRAGDRRRRPPACRACGGGQGALPRAYRQRGIRRAAADPPPPAGVCRARRADGQRHSCLVDRRNKQL
ncbi:hypothetical protein RLIN73S_05927 [Rhodanobacter lindaniclasticus]